MDNDPGGRQTVVLWRRADQNMGGYAGLLLTIRWAPYESTVIRLRRTMSPIDASQLIERLPPELLEKVWAFASLQDLLRMKQVGGLYDRFRDSS